MTERTYSDAELQAAVRDFHRVEMIGTAHIAPGGSVHVSDHGILTHTGRRSVFNRATALDLGQFDVTLTEAEEFFDGLAHSLWIEDGEWDDDVTDLLSARGYVALPPTHGVATTSPPARPGTVARTDHPDLLTDPAMASPIADVIASGFGLGPDDRLLFEDIARAVLRHAKPWDHGAVYGIPGDDVPLVAVGALLCTAHAAGISGLATLPRHRERGHATAILGRALDDAAALGYPVGVVMAAPDSVDLLHSLGFRPVLRYRVYRWSGR